LYADSISFLSYEDKRSPFILTTVLILGRPLNAEGKQIKKDSSGVAIAFLNG
jgi:hypothetical protein